MAPRLNKRYICFTVVVINVLIIVAKILFFSELGSFFVTISLVEGLIGEVGSGWLFGRFFFLLREKRCNYAVFLSQWTGLRRTYGEVSTDSVQGSGIVKEPSGAVLEDVGKRGE